jgi:hypothetical protein
MIRASVMVLTIWPKPALMFTPGTPKLARLNALKNSALNCSTEDEGQDRLISPAGTDRRKGKGRGHAADGQRGGEFPHGHTGKSGEKNDGLRDAVGKAAGQDDSPTTAVVE